MNRKYKKVPVKKVPKNETNAVFVMFQEMRFYKKIDPTQAEYYIMWQRPLPFSWIEPDGIPGFEPKFYFKFTNSGKKDERGRYLFYLNNIEIKR